MRLSHVICTGLLAAFSTASLAEIATAPKQSLVSVMDQRNPRYQMSIEHLSRVNGLLEKAQAEAVNSARMKPLPGFDYAALQDDIERIQRQLNRILLPEDRRLQYQRLVPDAGYLIPTQPSATSKE